MAGISGARPRNVVIAGCSFSGIMNSSGIASLSNDKEAMV